MDKAEDITILDRGLLSIQSFAPSVLMHLVRLQVGMLHLVVEIAEMPRVADEDGSCLPNRHKESVRSNYAGYAPKGRN